jgi:hypothetical protein
MTNRPDNNAVAALNAEYIKPAFFAYLDVLGDPLRATTWPADRDFEGTGDPDLDGHRFHALRPELVDISGVTAEEGGTATVTASLSGLILPDTELLNTIANPANWRGRVARLWMGIHDENSQLHGAVWHYYTGRMVAMPISGNPETQTIEVQIEGYLASIRQASNRTYLDQAEFDPGDLSAEASIAIANGLTGTGLAGSGGGSGGAYGGGGSAKAVAGRMIESLL